MTGDGAAGFSDLDHDGDSIRGDADADDPAGRLIGSEEGRGRVEGQLRCLVGVDGGCGGAQAGGVDGLGSGAGGWVMAQVDVAGAIPAMRRARGRVATVSVNSFLFKQPVSVGDIVSLYAEIERVGRTSITVKVEVYAERNYSNPIIVKVTDTVATRPRARRMAGMAPATSTCAITQPPKTSPF